MSTTQISPHVATLAYAYGCPEDHGTLRLSPEDFNVYEFLSFELSGKGNHGYLQIEKTNRTTEEVARQLARFVGVPAKAVGYAGLKDKNAITCQWFSVDLSGRREPHWSDFNNNCMQIKTVTRHVKKLKIGAIKCNRFRIIMSDLRVDTDALCQRLEKVRQFGVPNYFAEQRFGRDEKNLHRAYEVVVQGRRLKDRYLRGLYLSAARSYLFNRVLSQRVQMRLWDQAVDGDALILNGSHSFFVIDHVDETISQRIQQFDIHPSGPMWGKGDRVIKKQAEQIETLALESEQPWCRGLEALGLKAQRRALRLPVVGFEWEFLPSQRLLLQFTLPSGAYATSVIRELITMSKPQLEQ